MNCGDYYRDVLEDIAAGRWNTGSRVLDTKDNLTANQYARAALAGTARYDEAHHCPLCRARAALTSPEARP